MQYSRRPHLTRQKIKSCALPQVIDIISPTKILCLFNKSNGFAYLSPIFRDICKNPIAKCLTLPYWICCQKTDGTQKRDAEVDPIGGSSRFVNPLFRAPSGVSTCNPVSTNGRPRTSSASSAILKMASFLQAVQTVQKDLTQLKQRIFS